MNRWQGGGIDDPDDSRLDELSWIIITELFIGALFDIKQKFTLLYSPNVRVHNAGVRTKGRDGKYQIVDSFSDHRYQKTY